MLPTRLLRRSPPPEMVPLPRGIAFTVVPAADRSRSALTALEVDREQNPVAQAVCAQQFGVFWGLSAHHVFVDVQQLLVGPMCRSSSIYMLGRTCHLD